VYMRRFDSLDTVAKGMFDLEPLQAQLHYSFRDATLLEEALTAAGATVSSCDVDGPVSGNKRLALIGDAVLRLSILDEWYPGGDSTGKLKMTHHTWLTRCMADTAKRSATTW
jgi:dsRNA-specific ribonuclease